MKIKLKQLIISNFMSFGKKETVINLDTDISTLILGINRDVGREGQSRNGVGKSTIFQALVWVLFNEGIEAIKQDQFINLVNKKKMLVTLIFEVDGIELVLKRGRKPAILELTKDGEPYTMHSVSTVDESIRELIGMNFDTFTNTQLLSTNITPYMAMKPAPQRDLMERMVGLDVLSKRAAVVKAKLKGIAVDIKLEEQKIENDTRNHEKAVAYVEKLSGDSDKFEKDRANSIEDLENELKVLGDVDIEKERKANAKYAEINEKIAAKNAENDHKIDIKEKELEAMSSRCDNELAAIKTEFSGKIAHLKVEQHEEVDGHKDECAEVSKGHAEAVRMLDDQLNELSNDYELVDAAISKARRELSKGEDKIENLSSELKTLESGTCPYCGQKHTDKDKVAELKQDIADTIVANENFTLEIEQNEQLLSEYEKKAEKVQKELTKAESVRDKFEEEVKSGIKEIENKYGIMMDELDDESRRLHDDTIKDYADSTKLLEEEIAELKKYDAREEYPDNTKPEYSDEDLATIVSEIKSTKKGLDDLQNKENPFTSLLKDAKKEVKNTKVDKSNLYDLKEKEEHCKILVKLLTDSKSFVRKRLLEQYVPYINQRIAYYTERLDLPHVVTLNSDLTTDITYMNNAVSYGNLSNGERGRLNFSMSMALRDLMSVSGHSFNALFIDELLDNGIDTSGFLDIFKILKNKEGESLFIISHRDDLITEVDTVSTVIKENGFTHVVPGLPSEIHGDFEAL
jgi:DNA repair exonuclease SbcCD ATPase subunit